MDFTSFLRGLPRSKTLHFHEMKNSYRMTSCLNIRVKLFKDLAEKESCVIVGKCADYVLKGQTKCGEHLY